MEAQCWTCRQLVTDPRMYACPDCGGTLMLQYPGVHAGEWKDDSQTGLWKYRRLLPGVTAAHRLYLGEGGTPLVLSLIHI